MPTLPSATSRPSAQIPATAAREPHQATTSRATGGGIPTELTIPTSVGNSGKKARLERVPGSVA